MTLTIYHNPRCSKSRKTLELIEQSGHEPEVIRYLDAPPTPERIRALARLLDMPVSALLRRGEAEFREAGDLPDLADDTALANWLARHPRVIERPIVVDDAGARAVIGRPPENVLSLIKAGAGDA